MSEEEDFLHDLGFEQEEIDEMKLFTFNKKDKVAEKKPFREPQPVDTGKILEAKIEQRSEERCAICGGLKEKVPSRRNWDGKKFVMRCKTCTKNRRKRVKK